MLTLILLPVCCSYFSVSEQNSKHAAIGFYAILTNSRIQQPKPIKAGMNQQNIALDSDAENTPHTRARRAAIHRGAAGAYRPQRKHAARRNTFAV
jgi:hypothetical protein